MLAMFSYELDVVDVVVVLLSGSIDSDNDGVFTLSLKLDGSWVTVV